MMAEYKNQHYVPHSYLRFFACDMHAKKINLFNFKRNKVIPSVGIKNQCSKDYFYGKDKENEKKLSVVESEAASVIGKIVLNEEIPAQSSAGHLAFLSFITLQVARTTFAANEMTEGFVDLIKKIWISKNPSLEKEIESARFNASNVPIMNLASACRSFFILTDLEFRIFKNETGEGFVTSDNPAIRYNILYETEKQQFAMTGFSLKGLLIFLPLSSKYQLVFFDPTSYKISPENKILSLSMI